jgi:hypothetical protein
MADSPILMPYPVRQRGNLMAMIGAADGYGDGSNEFLARSFVVLSSGNLIAVATDGVLASGLTLEASFDSTTIDPPSNRYGGKHWPLDLTGLQFYINITNDDADIGEANGAPQLSDVTIGASYALIRPASGTYAGYHLLNVSDTTNTLFKVIDKPARVFNLDNGAAVYNGFVLAEVISSKIVPL